MHAYTYIPRVHNITLLKLRTIDIYLHTLYIHTYRSLEKYGVKKIIKSIPSQNQKPLMCLRMSVLIWCPQAFTKFKFYF